MANDFIIYNGDEIGYSVEKSVRASLEDYKNLTLEQMQKAVNDTGKEVLKATKKNAKSVLGKYRSPKNYISGLKASKVPAAMRRYEIVIHNSKKPGLSHLLQHGHAGPAPAAAKEHFPSDAQVEEILMKNMEKALK